MKWLFWKNTISGNGFANSIRYETIPQITIKIKVTTRNKYCQSTNRVNITFQLFGLCDINYDLKDLNNNLHKFQFIYGTIHQTLREQCHRKVIILKFHKTMAVPTLLYSCENWSPYKKINQGIWNEH